VNKTIFIITVLLVIAALILVIPELVFSQPPPPPGKPAQAPIDGGLGILAAAGGAYAIKKLRDRQK
jgi:hypothetical protein